MVSERHTAAVAVADAHNTYVQSRRRDTLWLFRVHRELATAPLE